VITEAETVQQEAVGWLREVIDELTSGSPDIKRVLRKCLHVTMLVKWYDKAAWIQLEISGYPKEAAVPWYRRVRGKRTWRPEGMYNILEMVVDEAFGRAMPEEPIEKEIRAGIDTLINCATSGVAFPTGARDEREVGGKTMDVMEVERISKETCQRVLSRLEDQILPWATESYTALGFGDLASDVWQAYRLSVDEALTALGLGGHFQAINDGLASTEPQAWRQAMWTCRDVLHDLAVFLWRDSRKTYKHIPGEDGQPMKVTEDKYVNRLAAYLHQKGVTGTTGAYLRAELARLHALNDLHSTAHDSVTIDQSRLAVIATYVVLGELIARTDMQPIEKYV
jgi:hypothetical protein